MSTTEWRLFTSCKAPWCKPPAKPPPCPTGLTSLNLRDVKHGAFKVIDDHPLKLLTVHIVDKGKPLYDYVN